MKILDKLSVLKEVSILLALPPPSDILHMAVANLFQACLHGLYIVERYADCHISKFSLRGKPELLALSPSWHDKPLAIEGDMEEQNKKCFDSGVVDGIDGRRLFRRIRPKFPCEIHINSIHLSAFFLLRQGETLLPTPACLSSLLCLLFLYASSVFLLNLPLPW